MMWLEMNANEYFEVYKEVGKERALRWLCEDTISVIKSWLDDLDHYTLFDILHAINEDFYRMEDLNDVYYNLSVTAVLEELDWVELYYEYFNSDTENCGDDLWDVSELDIDDVAQMLFDSAWSYCDNGRLNDILSEYEEIRNGIENKFKFYENAKILFDMAMEKSPEETIALLWNMNN